MQIKHIFNRKRILLSFLDRTKYKIKSDKLFIQLSYYARMGKVLDLKHPKTMNEKLQWLKLYNRRPEYTAMVDKCAAKEYVASIIGEEYIIPTIGIWNDAKDIDFDSLPLQFVLKANHDSGEGMVICKDKSKLDKDDAIQKLNTSLKHNYFYLGREWPYKNVKPCVFAEKYISDDESGALTDYKFYCFDGHVDSVMLCIDRQINDPKFYFFDRDWNLRRYNKRGKAAPVGFTLPKPDGIERMFEIASILSKNIPFARIDLYNVKGKIYFGEITLFPSSGFDVNRLPETDLYFGNMIKLPIPVYAK